jgi:hypothetical protein
MRSPIDRIAAFVEDLIRNRRPRRFIASPEEMVVLRAAAELSAARPGENLPNWRFIDQVCADINVTVRTVLAERRRLPAEGRERTSP